LVPLRIEVRKKALDNFKRRAKLAYPKEILAYLIGEKLGDLYLVEDMYFPEMVELACAKDAVYYQDWWPEEAKEYAKDHHLEVIGDIHTHPRKFKKWKGLTSEVTPSEGDYVNGWNGICGICAVTELKSKRLKATVAFYGPTPRVEFKEVP
jgi:hypothetical protein